MTCPEGTAISGFETKMGGGMGITQLRLFCANFSLSKSGCHDFNGLSLTTVFTLASKDFIDQYWTPTTALNDKPTEIPTTSKLPNISWGDIWKNSSTALKCFLNKLPHLFITLLLRYLYQ